MACMGCKHCSSCIAERLSVFEAAVFEAALHPEEDGKYVFFMFMWLVNQLQSGKDCSKQQTVASQRISACWS